METIGLIISILVGLTTLLAIVIWCGKFIQQVNEHDKKLDLQGTKIDEQGKNIDKLVRLVESHDHRILSLAEDMAEVKRDLYGLKNDVADLRVTVASINGFLSSGVVTLTPPSNRKHSPRTLTEIGLKVFKDMDGAKFLEKNKKELFAILDRLKLKTAYDVEHEALMALISLSSTDMFIPIKSFLYNYPVMDLNDMAYEVTLAEACRILFIPLRDMYLEEHPEIVR